MNSLKIFLNFFLLPTAFAQNAESLFPSSGKNSCGARCNHSQMDSPMKPENRLVENQNGRVNSIMPGQCMGNTLMHQMLLAGGVFKPGPEMAPEEVNEKLKKLQQGEAQVFSGVRSISELSEKYSMVLKEFADKLQMKSFYSLNRISTAFKLLTGFQSGSGSDLKKMVAQTDEGKRPALLINSPGALNSAHIVLVDKVVETKSGYSISYVDSNDPKGLVPNRDTSVMHCDFSGQCQTPLYRSKVVRALNGSEEQKNFALITQKCCLESSSSRNNELFPSETSTNKDHS